MRFKTFRNFIIVPGGLLLTVALGGALFLLVSSASCGSGTTTPTTRSPELHQAQPANATPVSQPQRQAASPASRDEKILALLEAKRNQSGDKIKDAFPRETYKVNIYRDGGSTTWNRLKIDYNRNERWDERWELEDGKPVKKQVSTADNDVYDQEWRWQGGQWVKKN
ncbi:MAG: hypothetical protein H0U54_10930 [Acidobacteria bacterium]|jgi:hypothetical protein|nr:hypothetical protein [Acidobacteriota bacterium]